MFKRSVTLKIIDRNVSKKNESSRIWFELEENSIFQLLINRQNKKMMRKGSRHGQEGIRSASELTRFLQLS